VLVLPAEDVVVALAACPWDVAGNLLHLFWCWGDPDVDNALLKTLKAEDEELVIVGRWAWFHPPSGAARSKLMAKMERVLGVAATARNLNTVRKLAQMVQA
jgi:uncharacterized protein (DUF1697 family)